MKVAVVCDDICWHFPPAAGVTDKARQESFQRDGQGWFTSLNDASSVILGRCLSKLEGGEE